MLMALTLGQSSRRIWIYDTFEGMPDPGEHDRRFSGEHARESLRSVPRVAGESNDWAWASLDDVRANMGTTGHTDVEFVAGKVEETIPARGPDQIAVLRLDADWYESTRHELEHSIRGW